MSEFNPLLLLASPQLTDPNFAKSVVLILNHNDDGALGLIINRPLSMRLGSLEGDAGQKCDPDLKEKPVFRGGPVEPEKGWILHADTSIPEKREVLPGLLLSSSQDSLVTLLERGAPPIKLILGYSGWDAGQLKEEMISGNWIPAEVDLKYIFETPPEKTWQVVLADLGVDPTRIVMGPGLH